MIRLMLAFIALLALNDSLARNMIAINICMQTSIGWTCPDSKEKGNKR